MTMRHGPCLAALLALLALARTAAAQSGPWTDDFNRPNGAIGGNWNAANGTFSINNNRGVCNGGSQARLEHMFASGYYKDMDVAIDFLPKFSGSSLIYVGFAIGLLPSWESIFVKLQDNNGDGLYDRLFFEPAIDAGGGWGPVHIADLAVPTASGRMRVHFSTNGDAAIVDIDRNFDGTFDETIQSPGILAANLNLGTNVAVVCYGWPMFDNFYCKDTANVPPPTNYCTSSTTTHGCVPTMGAFGAASVSAPSGFSLACANVEAQQTGVIFYGTHGAVAVPWAAGSTSFLCVKTPLQRMLPQNAGGTYGYCDGALSADFLAFMAANPTALGQPLAAGQQFSAQAWFRDPPAPKTTNLSDGLAFTMLP